MPDAPHKRWTLDEFLTWDDGADRHYELVAGEIVAMAPPSRAHGTLAVRVARIFDEQLRGPCSATAQAGIVLPDRDDAYYEADLAVSCRAAVPGEQFLSNPVVIVEILSPNPNTTKHDRGVKLNDDRTLPSVQEIVLISATAWHVELWRRTGTVWTVQDLVGEAVFRLDSVGVEMSMAALYDGVVL